MPTLMALISLKIYAAFTQKYMLDWAACLGGGDFGDTVFDIGIEILFNLEMLRQLSDNNTSLFSSLRGAPLSVHPRLFLAFILATKRHRGALFGQSSSQQSLGGLDDIRSAATSYFISTQVLVESKKEASHYWDTQMGLCRVIREQSMFTGQQELEDVLHRIVDYALIALKSYSIAEEQQLNASKAAETLAIITSIEYMLISPALSRIFARLYLVGVSYHVT